MINTSHDLILVNSAITNVELTVAIRRAIAYAVKLEADYYGLPNGEPVIKAKTHWKAGVLWADELLNEAEYSRQFLNLAFYLITNHEFYKPRLPPTAEALLPSYHDPLPKLADLKTAHKWAPFRRSLQGILIHLWSQQVLMLPWIFNPGPNRTVVFGDLLTEVAALFFSLEYPKARESYSYSRRRDWKFRDATRFVLATNWHSFERITLFEIAQLNTFAGSLGMQDKPFRRMLTELLKHRDKGITFSENDVTLYKR